MIKKVNRGRTDQRIDIVTYRVACTRLKRSEEARGVETVEGVEKKDMRKLGELRQLKELRKKI